MLVDYGECERRVLLSEGGYVNNPRDPGGPTNWGITLTDARLHWKPNATAEDVRAMPRSVAETIYKEKYWNVLQGDQLPAGVDYTVFDYGVNSGVGRAGRVLRAVLGLPSNTRHVDQTVLDKLQNVDAVRVIEAVNRERLSFMRRLRAWPYFGHGWERRVEAVQAFSKHLALHDSPDISLTAYAPTEPSAKAYSDDTAVDVTAMQVNASAQTVAPEAPTVSQLPTPADDSSTEDSPAPPSMLRSKTGWAAVGLGGSGALSGLQQANEYASEIAQAKQNWSDLSVNDVLTWVWHHPLVFVPVIVIAAAAFVWEDHRKYKRLLHEMQRARKQ